MIDNSEKTIKGYRGKVFYFIANPAKDHNSYKYYENGVLYVENGYVLDVGDYEKLSNRYKDVSYINYTDKLIMPGFIDTHVHFPQLEMVALYGEQLLEWLNKYTFPTEKKYFDKKYCEAQANLFMNELINNGTTSAAIYPTVSTNSVNTIFTQALNRNMRIISGKVMMDRNAPDYLLDSAENSYNESLLLISKWHKHKRLSYAVTPRFAITSSPEELGLARKLLSKYPDLYLQTHVSENKAEIKMVKELYPNSSTYLEVYNSYDLLHKRSIFGHAVYLEDSDYELMNNKKSSIAFCPSSNLFLGSGLFDINKTEYHNIDIGLGSDIGAGTSLSLLKTMADAYKVSQLRKISSDNNDKSLNALMGFYYATLGAAKSLDIDSSVGTFKKGYEADFIVLDVNEPSILKQRQNNIQTIDDLLFSLMILGDDRTIESVYIMGKCYKRRGQVVE